LACDHLWRELAANVSLQIGGWAGGVCRRFTSATWIATIGGMCYTIYLIHFILFQVGTSVLLRFIPVHDLASGTLLYGNVLIPPLLVVSAGFFLLIEGRAWILNSRKNFSGPLGGCSAAGRRKPSVRQI
jgi:peptidoglycan/LPS O-acetylase OafA/YrhL